LTGACVVKPVSSGTKMLTKRTMLAVV